MERLKGLQEPSAGVVLNRYKSDIISGINGQKPQEKINSIRLQNSTMMEANDPIEILLLVDTALYDSKDYEILSQSEVDEMKLQCQSISKHIEQTKLELMILSKFRDTNLSVMKLYSPSSSDSTSLEIQPADSNEQAQLNKQELMENERKCEELAVKLFHLEKELILPQERLLRHTAGILQMTHKDSEDTKNSLESSESRHTYTNTKRDFEAISEDFLVDERSLYRALEDLSIENNVTSSSSDTQINMINKIEKKLIALNQKLRQTINELNPESASISELSLRNAEKGSSTDTLEDYLEIIEQSIETINLEQGLLRNRHAKITSQCSDLVEQKEVLQRQVTQQRNQSILSDSAKDSLLDEKANEIVKLTALQSKKTDELESLQSQVKSLSKQLDDARQIKVTRDQAQVEKYSTELQEVEKKLELAESKIRIAEEKLRTSCDNLLTIEHEAQEAESKLRKAEETSRIARAEVETRDQSISKLEAQLRSASDIFTIENSELKSKITSLETQIKSSKEELASAILDKSSLDMAIQERDLRLEKKEKEIDELQMDIARLQTEVTIAKAELEGAYGSRSQRAAQMAANPITQKEIDRLTLANSSLVTEINSLKAKESENLMQMEENTKELKKELAETIEEYERMTKASIEWEKERQQLEGLIDSLREAKEEIESQLSDERVRLMEMRNPETEALSNSTSTSTTVLKNEFKKMMRDTRAESAKLLRAEQSERRRLEEELRTLKNARSSDSSSVLR